MKINEVEYGSTVLFSNKVQLIKAPAVTLTIDFIDDLYYIKAETNFFIDDKKGKAFEVYSSEDDVKRTIQLAFPDKKLTEDEFEEFLKPLR